MSQLRVCLTQRFFRALAFGNVRRATDKLHQITRLAPNRMANGVDVFALTAGTKDSEFHIVVRPFNDCAIDRLLPSGSVVRMNALESLLPGWQAVLPVETIDAIPFLRQVQGISSRHIPDPTPGVREPLRFRQITLAALQGLFRRLALTTLCF